MHLFRDSYTAKWPYIAPSECDDYAFCKVCDDSFSIAHGSGNDVSHGIEQTVKTNSTVRQFCCNFTKTLLYMTLLLCQLLVHDLGYTKHMACF